MVSGWPGVTKPSEPTRAFRKMNFVSFLAERSTPVMVATDVAGMTKPQATTASIAAAVWVPLPSDTR